MMLRAIYDTEGMVISTSEPLTSEQGKKTATIKMRHINPIIEEAMYILDSKLYKVGVKIPFK